MAGDGLVGLNCPRGQKEVEISEPESIPDVDLISILVRIGLPNIHAFGRFVRWVWRTSRPFCTRWLGFYCTWSKDKEKINKNNSNEH